MAEQRAVQCGAMQSREQCSTKQRAVQYRADNSAVQTTVQSREQCRAESSAVPCLSLCLLMPGPFLGPGNRGSDQWECLRFESFLVGEIGLVVNKYPTLGEQCIISGKSYLCSSLIIKY